MENYHLHRPQAMECSPSRARQYLYRGRREGRGGEQKHKLNEVLEGRERGKVLIIKSQLCFVISHGKDVLTNFSMCLCLDRVDVQGFTFDVQSVSGKYV